MPAVFLCDLVEVDGDFNPFGGISLEPGLPQGTQFVCLMADSRSRKAVVVSNRRALTGSGVTRLVHAATRSELMAAMRTTGPTAQQRTAIANWLTANGYELPASGGSPSWAQTLRFICRQVNTSADPESVVIPGSDEP